MKYKCVCCGNEVGEVCVGYCRSCHTAEMLLNESCWFRRWTEPQNLLYSGSVEDAEPTAEVSEQLHRALEF